MGARRGEERQGPGESPDGDQNLGRRCGKQLELRGSILTREHPAARIRPRRRRPVPRDLGVVRPPDSSEASRCTGNNSNHEWNPSTTVQPLVSVRLIPSVEVVASTSRRAGRRRPGRLPAPAGPSKGRADGHRGLALHNPLGPAGRPVVAVHGPTDSPHPPRAAVRRNFRLPERRKPRKPAGRGCARPRDSPRPLRAAVQSTSASLSFEGLAGRRVMAVRQPPLDQEWIVGAPTASG